MFLTNSLDSLWHTSDNSLVIENNNETISVTGAFTRATNVESEIGIAYLSSSHPKKQPKAHGCLNSYTAIESIILFLDCPTTVSIDLPQNRVEQTVREGEYKVAAIVNLSGVIVATLSFPERESQRDLAQNKEED